MNVDNADQILSSILNMASNAANFIMENRPTDLPNAGFVYGVLLGSGGLVYMFSNPYSSFTSALVNGGFGYVHAYIFSMFLSSKYQHILCNMLASATVYAFFKQTYVSIFGSSAENEAAKKSSVSYQLTKEVAKSLQGSSIGNNVYNICYGNDCEKGPLDEH